MNAVIPCSKGVHCNWPACPQDCPERPGKTKPTKPHYGSHAHKRWRDEVQRRAKWKCEECGRRTRRMFSDHIVELEDGGDPFDLENGRCLCGKCHSLKTHANAKRRKNGNVSAD